MDELTLIEAMSMVEGDFYTLYVHPSKLAKAQHLTTAFPEIEVCAAGHGIPADQWFLVRRTLPLPTMFKLSETDK